MDYFTDEKGFLKNKLHISDPVAFHAAETEIVYARMIELDLNFYNLTCHYDFECLKMIHKKLFSDIYAFAGKVRTVWLAKDDSVFCMPEFIEENQRRIFAELARRDYLKNLSEADFVQAYVDLAEELNVLHPFREGNGRATRFFLKKLSEHAGWSINYAAMSTDDIILADREAFFGRSTRLTDLIKKNIYPLCTVFPDSK